MRIDEPDGSIEKTAERLREYACVSVGMSLKTTSRRSSRGKNLASNRIVDRVMSLKRSQSDESNRKTWWGHRGWMPESTRGETSCRRLVESARRHIKNNNKKKEEKEKKKTGEHGGCSCYSSSPSGSLPDDRWPPLLLLGSCVSAPTYPHQCFHHTHTHHPELNRASSCCYGWWLDDIWLSFSGGRAVAGGLTSSSSSVYFSLRLRRYSRSAKHKHQYII